MHVLDRLPLRGIQAPKQFGVGHASGLLLRHSGRQGIGVVKREVQDQDVDPRHAEDTEKAALRLTIDDRRHLAWRDAARGRDPRRLSGGVGERDVGIEAAARGGDRLDRNHADAVLRSVGGGALGNVFNETTEPTNFRLTVGADVGQTNNAQGTPVGANQTFALTDLILQNPSGDQGNIRVLINGVPILESALQNFRDLDFHFVAPYVVPAGQNISIEIDCSATQILPSPTDPCADAVSFSGFTTTVTEVPATSAP